MKRSGGRTVSVRADTQTVSPIVACVTAGSIAPGVRIGFGKADRAAAVPEADK
jgi:hypothetical protein